MAISASCKAKAKSKFKVWPSAYASAWGMKCTKGGASLYDGPSKIKGGGTKKVCLPEAKINSMSSAEKSKVIKAKEAAGKAGKYKRSRKSFVKGARPKGKRTLRDWFNEKWKDVKTGKVCGAAMYDSPLNLKFGRKKKQVKLSVGRGEKLSVKKGSGLTAKGRAKYNKATGSNLKAPVTGKVKAGSKASKRRKSFCARSRSWKGPRGIAARKRWKC